MDSRVRQTGITVLLLLLSGAVAVFVFSRATDSGIASTLVPSPQILSAQAPATWTPVAAPVRLPAVQPLLHPRPLRFPTPTVVLTAHATNQPQSPLALSTVTIVTMTVSADATLPSPAQEATEVDSITPPGEWSLLPTSTSTRLGFPLPPVEQTMASTVPITEHLGISVPGAPELDDGAEMAKMSDLGLVPTPTPILTPTPTHISPLEPTPDGVVRQVRVPILMYHYVSVPPPGSDIYRQDLSVAPELFAAHLDAMQSAGYKPISMSVLVEHLANGALLPENPIIITFDDGYRDIYENAFPLLKERRMTAAFFVVTDFIDKGRPEYLTWDMAREMLAAGMSIESHGRNHVSLENKDTDYLVWQALGSMETIEYELGVRPRFVSYPAGEYDQATIDIFQSANYWAGLATAQGATHSNQNLFELLRVRVRGTTSPEELLRLLALDW